MEGASAVEVAWEDDWGRFPRYRSPEDRLPIAVEGDRKKPGGVDVGWSEGLDFCEALVDMA